MELTLNRQDLVQVSATCRKTMRLLPSKKKQQQKVLVGDDTGSLLCFGMKRYEQEQVFKTPPTGKEISRVELSGVDDERDKIFWASGSTVRAMTKKGKEYLRFNTNVTETIRSMYVGDEDIHTGGDYIYNQFVSCKDTGFYMATDRINDITCERLSGSKAPEIMLGCQDRMVRVLHASGSDLLFEQAMDGPVCTLEQYHNPVPGKGAVSQGGGFGPSSPDRRAAYDANDGSFKELVYGTENGQLGLLLVDGRLMRRGWVVDPMAEGRRAKSGGVQCICTHDVSHDGIKDLIIGRDDGLLEVWSFDMGPHPKLVFERALHESLTSVDCGLVCNTNYDEVVVATYSGKVISFSSQPSGAETDEPAEQPEKKTSKKGRAARGQQPEEEGGSVKERGDRKIRGLRQEIEKLHEKVEKEKERYGKVSESLIAAEVQFKMNDKWTLKPEDACYQLHVELSMPLETVLLQCDVPIELLDADSNVAIVSLTPPAPGSAGVLATYRCQAGVNVNRLELNIRTSEGRYGSLQAYVWPRISPKTARAASYPIKPLSLHTRLHEVGDESALPLMSILKITGTFSLPEVHSWVVACLPEVPARLQNESATFAFRNTFLDTLLLCAYQGGEAVFRSDSLTTLAIVKEVVTKEATARKIQIQVSVEAKEETVPALLRRIDPMMRYQLSLSNKVKLIETLKEVKMQEPDTSFLAPEYVEILDNEEQIKKELKEQPGRLQFLYGIITDLYVDNYKFKGQNVTQHVPQLQRALEEYSLEAVLAFFVR